MKKKITLLFFVLFASKCLAVNDIKQLEKTIESFQKQFLVKPLAFSNEFILTFEEFTSLALLQSKDKPDLVQLRKEYDNYYLTKIVNKVQDFNDDAISVQAVLSHDTLTYHERQNKKEVINFIDISFEIKYKSKFEENEIVSRFILKFIIINNKIKLAGQFHSISDLEYRRGKLDILKTQEKSDFLSKYKEEIFASSRYNCIPKFKNGKWGLVTFKGEEIVPCMYDSIHPFEGDYAIVRINGKYNLLDTSFKQMLKSNAAKIKCEYGSYSVLNTKKEYVPFPFANNNKLLTVESAAPVRQTKNQQSRNNEDPEKDIRVAHDYNSTKQKNNHFVINTISGDTLARKSGFNYIDIHGKFLYGVKDDISYLMDLKGTELFKTKFTCNYNSYNYIDVFNNENRLFGIYCPDKNLYIEPKYLLIYAVENQEYFIVLTKYKEVRYLDGSGNELF